MREILESLVYVFVMVAGIFAAVWLASILV